MKFHRFQGLRYYGDMIMPVIFPAPNWKKKFWLILVLIWLYIIIAPQKSGNESALKRLSDFYKSHNIQWILNLESSNWEDTFIDDDGYDWYNHFDGRHYFMFPEKVLESFVRFIT